MKIRKSTKYIFILIFVLLIVISGISIITNITKNNIINNNKEIYNYTNKFNYNYTVNLLENKYIPKTTYEMSQNYYVTDLIDNINLKFNYTYEGSKDTNINYDYEILGVLSAVYTKDGVERKIWEREDVLKEIVKNSKNGNKIDINENLILDLKSKNALVKEFENEMNMSVTADYTIMLKINTNTNIEGIEVKNKYIPLIKINLAQKVTTILGDNNIEKTEYISKEYHQKEKTNMSMLIISIIVFITSMILLIIVLKCKSKNIVRDEYRQELNKILRLCQDKIIKVNQNPNIGKTDIVDVVDFGEILKLSEEVYQPILYWYIEEKDEAQFSVISNNIVYRYILEK